MAVLLLVFTPLHRPFGFLGTPPVTRISMEAAGFWGCCNPLTAHMATQGSHQATGEVPLEICGDWARPYFNGVGDINHREAIWRCLVSVLPWPWQPARRPRCLSMHRQWARRPTRPPTHTPSTPRAGFARMWHHRQWHPAGRALPTAPPHGVLAAVVALR